jgi:hemerythrin superfamily protein
VWVTERNSSAPEVSVGPVGIADGYKQGYQDSTFAHSRRNPFKHHFGGFMRTSQNNTTNRAATRRAPTGKTASKSRKDAIKLLTEDHAKVKKLFREYEKLTKKEDQDGKEELAQQICKELTIHAQLEEEIFYPAAREAIKDDDLLNEALVEHSSAKNLISQIKSMKVDDPMYDAVVTVLGEYVNHHVQEEEEKIFPKVQKSKMDLEELGHEIAERKEELIDSE